MIAIDRTELELGLETANIAAAAALDRAAEAATQEALRLRNHPHTLAVVEGINRELDEAARQAARAWAFDEMLRRCGRAGRKDGVAPALWPDHSQGRT